MRRKEGTPAFKEEAPTRKSPNQARSWRARRDAAWRQSRDLMSETHHSERPPGAPWECCEGEASPLLLSPYQVYPRPVTKEISMDAIRQFAAEETGRRVAECCEIDRLRSTSVVVSHQFSHARC